MTDRQDQDKGDPAGQAVSVASAPVRAEGGGEGGTWADAPAALTISEEPGGPSRQRPRALRNRRRSRTAGGIGFILFFLMVGLIVLATLAALGRTLTLPVWAVAELETRLNDTLRDQAPGLRLSVGGISLALANGTTPQVELDDLRLLNDLGATFVRLPNVQLSFSAEALMEQRALRPATLRLVGAEVKLRRLIDGSFDLDLGGGGDFPKIMGLADLFAELDKMFQLPILSRLKTIEAEAMALSLSDARLNKSWTVGDGRLRLDNRSDLLATELGFSLANGQGGTALAQITLVRPKDEERLRVTATITEVAAADIAAQAPLLAWLQVLDAPISGRIAAEVTGEGVEALSGQLSLAKGALRPNATAKPIAFDSAVLRVRYDGEEGRLILPELSFQSPILRLQAQGAVYMIADSGKIIRGALGRARPAGFLGQIDLNGVQIDPEGLFERPLIFTDGAVDARLMLNPFRLDLGQVSLIEERGRRLTLNGNVSADAKGWQVAVDLALDAIAHDRLLQLWPKSLVSKTRTWIGENVAEGLLTNLRGAVRLTQGQEPRFSLSYDFAGAEVRVIKTLPPVQNGRGRSTIEGRTYTLVVEEGRVQAPSGGQIDVAGSIFVVPDITQRPAMGDVKLRAKSGLLAALALVDLPPCDFLTKAGRAVDLGEGQADILAHLQLPLVQKVDVKDVVFDVAGTVTDFSSDVLIKGKTITAPKLDLRAVNDGMTITGAGKLGAVPFDVTYDQRFSADQKGKSTITGTVALSPVTVKEFGLGLPSDMVDGSGTALMVLALERGKPGDLRLTSTLNGIGLRIPSIGWAKAPQQTGRLEVDATLDEVPQITRVELSASGLDALGAVNLRPGGGLDRAIFSRVRVQDWMEGPVELLGRGKGQAPEIRLNGGRVDLNRFNRPATVATTETTDASPLSVQLDVLQVTDTIAITGFSGEFSQLGGMNGTFVGLVNGAAPVQGTVVPSTYGTAVRIRSADAGAVLRAANVFSSAKGGAMDLRLRPRPGVGEYDGSVDIDNVRVTDANVLAELLSAISVVGLLEQLNGDGILFGRASANLVLTPQAVQISDGSATGASLGVTLAGLYGTQTKKLALQGVISPVYLLNGIGSALTRKGEGVFGFNYDLRGTADNPKVSVNPLSLLTPGLFRELFRAAPPVLEK